MQKQFILPLSRKSEKAFHNKCTRELSHCSKRGSKMGTFMFFVWFRCGGALGKFQNITEEINLFPLLGAVLRTNVELTDRLISQFSTERKSWCCILAGWRGSHWIMHHKVSSWVRPKGAAALMLQSVMYTVAHMAAGENTLQTALCRVSADSCESRDMYGGR